MTAEALTNVATLGLIATATCILWSAKGSLAAIAVLTTELNAGVAAFRDEVRDFRDEVRELREEVRQLENYNQAVVAIRKEVIHHPAPSSAAAPAHG